MQPAEMRLNQVYYVQRIDDNRPINVIAIRPHIKNNQIEWEDTSPTGTYFKAAKINVEPNAENPETIEVITPEGKLIRLQR